MSSSLRGNCEIVRVDSDVDSCGSRASLLSVVSSLVVASCDTEMFRVLVLSVGSSYSCQHLFERLNFTLSRRWQLGPGKDGKAGAQAAVRGMKASGKINSGREWKVLKVARCEGNFGRVSSRTYRQPENQECTWERTRRNDDRARVQTGRKSSMCAHCANDDRRAVLLIDVIPILLVAFCGASWHTCVFVLLMAVSCTSPVTPLLCKGVLGSYHPLTFLFLLRLAVCAPSHCSRTLRVCVSTRTSSVFFHVHSVSLHFESSASCNRRANTFGEDPHDFFPFFT